MDQQDARLTLCARCDKFYDERADPSPCVHHPNRFYHGYPNDSDWGELSGWQCCHAESRDALGCVRAPVHTPTPSVEVVARRRGAVLATKRLPETFTLARAADALGLSCRVEVSGRGAIGRPDEVRLVDVVKDGLVELEAQRQ